MLVLCALFGMIAVWLWLLPPASLTDRVRGAMIAASCLLFIGFGWATTRMMSDMNAARKSALRQYRKHRALQKETFDRYRAEAAGL